MNTSPFLGSNNPIEANLQEQAAPSTLLPKLFDDISDPLLNEKLKDCLIRHYSDGEEVLRPGQENRHVYILLSGRLRVFRDEKDVSSMDIQPGCCFGEMSIINRKPASAFVVAIGECQVQIIPESTFWELLGAFPKLVRNLLEILSMRIRSGDQVALARMRERIELEKEMEIAHSIQASMLTTDFDPISQAGIDLYAIMDPIKAVGGDFYDAFLITPTQLFICVGDVVGKGVPAALFMVRCLTHLRIEAVRDPRPYKILERVNKAICANNQADMFFTLFCGIVDIQTGELSYANGGHNPPLSDAANQTFDFIPMPNGVLVGVYDEAVYKSAVLTLKPGQSLIAYTDGVTEAMDESGELFGEERLLATVNRNRGSDARQIIEAIESDVYAFSENAHPSDDMTILALRYVASPITTFI
jgi:sigma-B regulation protein RsbU (phosphoserine phosphatase)